MSAQAAPTDRQLRFLRSLAQRTATTFTPPATRAEASREIDRLRRLQAAPRESAVEDEFSYATAVHEEELTGFGAARTWRSRAPGPGTPSTIARPSTSMLARYTLSTGERLIEGVRTPEGLTVRDVPAGGEGQAYAVERLGHEEAEAELPALLGDYLARAHELDAVPMSREALQTLTGGTGA